MRLFVYMLVNVNVIYYVHVCEQAHWARSVGNSAIENLCFFLVCFLHIQTNTPKTTTPKTCRSSTISISCWLTCSFDGSSVPQNCVLFWQTLGLKVLRRRQYLMTASLREGRLVSGIKLPQRKEQPLPSQVNYWNENTIKRKKRSKQSTFMFFATSVM